jgi:hypothetical protein
MTLEAGDVLRVRSVGFEFGLRVQRMESDEGWDLCPFGNLALGRTLFGDLFLCDRFL